MCHLPKCSFVTCVFDSAVDTHRKASVFDTSDALRARMPRYQVGVLV